MKRKRKDKRREERVSASLPVAMASAKGITRDVSASGVFFETDAAYGVGSPIRFVLNLDTPWGKVMFKCQGKIVWNVQRKTEANNKPMFYDIGIEFADVTDEERHRLEKIIQRLVKNVGETTSP